MNASRARSVTLGTTDIQVAGRVHTVPSMSFDDWTLVVTGVWPRRVAFKDEELIEARATREPARLLAEVKSSGLRADILSFSQPIPDTTPRHQYYFEWDSWAAIPITSFDTWWNKLPHESRKNVRRAARRGLVTGVSAFNDDLARSIQSIYDETPIRQGRPFWHYRKDFATIKRALDTYTERSEYIGAQLNGELVGFIKLTYVDDIAKIMQILAKNAFKDARPINALLAHAVELCEKRNMSYLIYGNYVYGRHEGSALTEFKRRNGFDEIRVPRYIVPLTLGGRVAISLKLHSGIRDRLPGPIVNFLLNLRSRLYDATKQAPR